MLGMNCIASGVDRVSQDLVTLVSKIQEKSPGIAVLIESVTPMTADSPRADGSLNNFTIQEFNEKMKAICQEKQWYYVNVAEAVTGDARRPEGRVQRGQGHGHPFQLRRCRRLGQLSADPCAGGAEVRYTSI